MKRIFFLCLMGLTFCSNEILPITNTCLAKDSTSLSVDSNIKLESNETTTFISSFEEEDNDNYILANCLADFPVSNGERPNDIHSVMFAKMDDYDCFYFNLYGNATVDIKLRDIADGDKFRFELVEPKKSILKYKESQYRSIFLEEVSNSLDKTFELEAYTYYLVIGRLPGWIGGDCNAVYCVDLTIHYEVNTYSLESVSVYDLKCNNYGGALWYSDFDPGYNKSFKDINLYNIDTYRLMNYISELDQIKLASLYIWKDNLLIDLKKELLKSVDDLRKISDELLETGIKNALQAVLDTAFVIAKECLGNKCKDFIKKFAGNYATKLDNFLFGEGNGTLMEKVLSYMIVDVVSDALDEEMCKNDEFAEELDNWLMAADLSVSWLGLSPSLYKKITDHFSEHLFKSLHAFYEREKVKKYIASYISLYDLINGHGFLKKGEVFKLDYYFSFRNDGEYNLDFEMDDHLYFQNIEKINLMQDDAYMVGQIFVLRNMREFASALDHRGGYTQNDFSIKESTLLVEHNRDYYETTEELNPYEVHYFRTMFADEGMKIFQTFGKKSTFIELYLDNGECFKIDNDTNGFDNNAFLNVHVHEREYYYLKVGFINPSDSGQIRLSITSSSFENEYQNIEEFPQIFEDNIECIHQNTFKTYSGSAFSTLFTPTSDEIYNFTLKSDPGFPSIRIIDPSSNDLVKNSMEYIGVDSKTINMSVPLEANRTYIIIVSSRESSGSSSFMSLGIQKMSLGQIVKEIDVGVSNFEYLRYGDCRWFIFEAPQSGYFTFESISNDDLMLEGGLYYSIGDLYGTNEIAWSDCTSNGDIYDFSVGTNLIEGRVVYLFVKDHGSSDGYFKISVNGFDNNCVNDQLIDETKLNFGRNYVNQETSSSYGSISVNRLRCGYIHDSSTGKDYLAMSAKRVNAGVAFLEFKLNERDIYGIQFSMAIWSENEGLNKNSSIIIETKGIFGEYDTYDCLDINSMPKNKDNPKGYSITFDDFTEGVRIKVITNQVESGTNKGRVVLSNIVISYACMI